MAAANPGGSGSFPLTTPQLQRIDQEGLGLRDITGASERGAAYALGDFARKNVAGQARVGIDLGETRAILQWQKNPASDPERGRAWIDHLHNTLLAICWDWHAQGETITLMMATQAQADGEPYAVLKGQAEARGDGCTFRKCGRLPAEGEYQEVARKSFVNAQSLAQVQELIAWVASCC